MRFSRELLPNPAIHLHVRVLILINAMFARLQSPVLVLFLLVLPVPCWAAAPTDMQRRFDEFNKVIRDMLELPEHARVPAITARFDALFDAYFAGQSLAALSDAEVELLFRATDDMAYFPSGAKYTDLLMRTHGELLRRSIATSRHHAALHGELIEARRFSEARALYRAHPEDLEALPELVAEPIDAPSVWAVDVTPNRLTRQALDADRTSIVALVHPRCHFSQKALATILSDPLLRPMFARHATLIVPTERAFRIDEVRQWNQEQPEFPMAFMHTRSDWPMFRAWGTPVFYFFRDGKLEETVDGWPQGGSREALLQAGTRLGLLKEP